MDVRPIRSEEALDWSLAEIAPYFDDIPEKGTPDADRFDVLANLIAAYEAGNHPVEALDPIDFITTYMEEAGLQQRDFAVVVGPASGASEFLNRKRPFTLNAVQEIHRNWRLPASVLIQPYHLAGHEMGDLADVGAGHVQAQQHQRQFRVAAADGPSRGSAPQEESLGGRQSAEIGIVGKFETPFGTARFLAEGETVILEMPSGEAATQVNISNQSYRLKPSPEESTRFHVEGLEAKDARDFAYYLSDEQIEKIIDTYQQHPESIERYARRVGMDEIEANDFNLNISRYVSTAKQDVAVDLSAMHEELVEIEKQIRESSAKHNAFLKELGLSPLPD